MSANVVETAQEAFLLVAEDNPADVGLIRLALKEHGVQTGVRIVSDGEAAVHFIDMVEADPAAACPALAILDLNLPRVSGGEILRRLRVSTKWRDVPVIVVSSSLSPRDRKDAIQLGASAYFAKPSDLEEFLRLGALISKILADQALLETPKS
jgi:CheY-like chemotaxis protein